MPHIKNGKVKETIGDFLAERLASAPLMKQMDHTLDSIHNYIAPRITDKGRIVSRKSCPFCLSEVKAKKWWVLLLERRSGIYFVNLQGGFLLCEINLEAERVFFFCFF